MIVRLSESLSKQIRVTPTELRPLNANPFADFTGHFFVAESGSYILAVNTASLYGVVFPGQRITRSTLFEPALAEQLRGYLVEDGFEFLYKRLIAAESATVSYSRPLNPLVSGAIRDLADRARTHLKRHRYSLVEVMEMINRSPLSAIQHVRPRDAFRTLTLHH